jgi:plastocyanin
MKAKSIYISAFIVILILSGVTKVHATTWVVSVQDFSFSPASLPNVRLGDTVQWNWVNGSHTTTSMTIPAAAAAWDNPLNIEFPTFKYVPSVTGVYNYKCTPHVSMGMTGSFTVSSNLGVADSPLPAEISISPNPFTSRILVSYRAQGSVLAEIKVFDVTGRMVRTVSTDDAGSGFSETIDLQDLKNGIYFIRFTDRNEKSYVKRIIKH